MISFPGAKINLGLNILSKRDDGYHEIESCLYPIPWNDVLEILPSDQFHFEQTGLTIDADPDQNLCCKAYTLLQKRYNLPPVHIHLHKVIPMGAGLGGGSSDAAFTLKMLNDLFNLGLKTDELEKLCATLGSDCPFFIRNKASLATGTGTMLEDIDIDLKGLHLVVIHPGIHVTTANAYTGVTPLKRTRSLHKSILQPIHSWKANLFNDFEPSIFYHFPEIQQLKELLYQKGASYAAMSGSGSAVYGCFENPVEIENDKLLIFQGAL